MGLFSYLLLLVVASLHTWKLIGDKTISHVSLDFLIVSYPAFSWQTLLLQLLLSRILHVMCLLKNGSQLHKIHSQELFLLCFMD